MNKKTLFLLKLIASILVLIFAFILSLCAGTEKISILKALNLLKPNADIPQNFLNVDRIILLNLRLPRSLLALVSGVLLAGSGAAFQLFFRNPLAEPGILGISSGATLGAVIAQVFSLTTVVSVISPVNVFAFAGALMAGAVVTILAAGTTKKETTVMLLLCGTALGTLYSSLASIILLTSDKELHSIYTWILGSFNGRGWNELIFILIPSFLAFIILIFVSSPLDLLNDGEQTALSLGVEVGRLRLLVLIAGSLSASAAVCAGGTISFVGLIAPHIVRKLFGSKAKTLIFISMIFGAALLLLADTLARILIAPSELPTGVITSVLGTPFFLALVAQKRRGG